MSLSIESRYGDVDKVAEGFIQRPKCYRNVR